MCDFISEDVLKLLGNPAMIKLISFFVSALYKLALVATTLPNCRELNRSRIASKHSQVYQSQLALMCIVQLTLLL